MTVPARGLLLDVGGVVLQPGPVMVNRWGAADARVAAVLDPLGGISGPGDDLWHRMIAGEVTERSYWAQRSRQLLAALGLPPGTEVADTRRLMRLVYGGPSRDWLQDQVVALMHEVKQAGIPLGALTNDMADFHGGQWVDEQDWVRLFDVVVDGSHTGILKPDPRAFAAGAAALELPPEQIVYVDDMPWNVEGGRQAGLQAIWLRHGDPDPGVAAARSLLDLSRDDLSSDYQKTPAPGRTPCPSSG